MEYHFVVLGFVAGTETALATRAIDYSDMSNSWLQFLVCDVFVGAYIHAS